MFEGGYHHIAVELLLLLLLLHCYTVVAVLCDGRFKRRFCPFLCHTAAECGSASGSFSNKKIKTTPAIPYPYNCMYILCFRQNTAPCGLAEEDPVQDLIFFTPPNAPTLATCCICFFSEFWIGTGTGKMVMSNSVLVSYFGCHEQFVKATLSKHSVQKPQWSVVSFSVSPNKTLWFIHHFLGVKTIKRSNHIRYPHNSVWPGCARHRSYSK